MTAIYTPKTPLEQLGGKAKLLEIIKDFYARVVNDPMIGFMFKSVNISALIEREYEFSAALLGASDVTYRGRGMRRAHAPLRIMGGQFARRQQLLRDTLTAHSVPEDITRAWLAHNESMRPQITADSGRQRGGDAPATSEATAQAASPPLQAQPIPLKGSLRAAAELSPDAFFPPSKAPTP
jgi:truncated hemoglobin YjbI